MENYYEELFGAFFGACFAFLAVRLQDWLTRIYECQVKNYNALVSLQYVFYTILDTIVINKFDIEKIKELRKSLSQDNDIAISYNRPSTIPFSPELLINLSNLDYINDLFGYNSTINRLNVSIENLNKSYDEIRSAVLQGNLDQKNYKTNLASYIERAIELHKFLVEAEKQTKELAAGERVLARSKPFFFYITRLFVNRRYGKNFQKHRAEEIKKIEEEIELISKTSTERIKRILSNDTR